MAAGNLLEGGRVPEPEGFPDVAAIGPPGVRRIQCGRQERVQVGLKARESGSGGAKPPGARRGGAGHPFQLGSPETVRGELEGHVVDRFGMAGLPALPLLQEPAKRLGGPQHSGSSLGHPEFIQERER